MTRRSRDNTRVLALDEFVYNLTTLFMRFIYRHTYEYSEVDALGPAHGHRSSARTNPERLSSGVPVLANIVLIQCLSHIVMV